MHIPARSSLLAGCALSALLVALSQPAAAQGFQGTSEVVTGDASIFAPGGGTYTDISVFSQETVINWTATDSSGTGTIDFLPEGHNVNFFDGEGVGEYTVLNRILPVNANGGPTNATVAFNGLVESYHSNEDIGGHIWFYSPFGIIAGPTAVFNVGSLILTTNDIQFVENDPDISFGSIYGPDGLVRFVGAENSLAAVEIQSGAQLNALGLDDAYVALVAPRIVQDGTVSADGNIAYIAAEQVDMTINGGLFDFTVTLGTTDAEGIAHSGTTTGPASDNISDSQRISMVAVPKNDALTMLLSGSIGYAPAATVFDEGSSIVLSAGFANDDPLTFSGADGGSIEIGNTNFLNPLTAWATSGIYVMPEDGTTSFGGATGLNAGEAIEVEATAREFVIGAADVSLNAGQPGTGGTIDVLAQTSDFVAGGVIDIAGTLSAYASSDGILSVVEPPLDGQGGTITMTADGGLIEATSLYATADGFGNFGSDLGGVGRGGTIDILAEGSGTISTQFVELNASGFGGDSDGNGGNGFGGEVTLSETDGALDFGYVSLRALGGGGDASENAGNGTGGTATVSITTQAQNWDGLLIDTSATPGRRASESEGLTGSASGGLGGSVLSITGTGSLAVNSDLILESNAYMDLGGAPGFTGQGGHVELTVADGGRLTVDGTLFAHASALLFSGEGGFGDPSSSPIMIGGTVDVTAEGGGSISAWELDARAEAVGMSGIVAAGTATGGMVIVSALDGGAISIEDEGPVLARISADAFGAPGPVPSHATGGAARIIVEDGSFLVGGDIELSASGVIGEFFEPPADGPGHDAFGGTATVELRLGSSGTALLEADNLTVSAVGDGRFFLSVGTLEPGGDPIRGDGGDGTGGTASLTMAAGTLTLNELTLDSSGTGGGSGIVGGGIALGSGDGFGGTSEFTIGGGDANIASLELLSNGQGGDGTSGSAAEGNELATFAGNGTGGNATLQLDGGSLRVNDTTLEALGTGAPGTNHIDDGDATDGGDGTGGSVALQSAADWTGSFSTTTLDLRGNGIGGVGGVSAGASAIPPTGVSGDGGDGTGGSATVDLADGEFFLGGATIEATGTGGDSGDASSGIPGAEGGYGTGGAARFALIDSPAGPWAGSGTRILDSLSMDASGFGGFGSISVAQSAVGEADLTVSVLNPDSALTLPGALTILATGTDLTPAGGIEALISGAPLQVGTDIVMSTGGPLTVMADEPLVANGFVTLNGYSVATTGLIQSGTEMFVTGLFGISSDRLTSGSTTSLDAALGPIGVADLLSADLVTATGQSIDIRSSGGLEFALARATGGDLYIETVDNLEVTSLSATGSVTLESSAGNIGTGDFTAGTWIYVDAFGSAALGNISAGIDAAVSTRGGNLTMGNVTAGDEIWLRVFGADPTRTLTAGNLVSTGLGSDTADGPPELFGGPGPIGNVTRVRSSGSITVGDVQTPGRAILVADSGTMTTGSLTGPEGLIVLGHGNIAIADAATDGTFYVADSAMFLPNLPDAYDPASLNGLTPVATTGNLAATGPVNAGTVTVAVGGDATLPDLTSAGTTFLQAGGTVDVDTLVSAGTVSVTGNVVGIVGSGPLTFTRAEAVNALSITTDGDLAFASVSAGLGLTLGSTGGSLTATGDATGLFGNLSAAEDILVEGDLSSGGNLGVIAGGTFTVEGDTLTDDANIFADGGITLTSLTSGEITRLEAPNGNIVVPELLTGGRVTALGQDVDIASSGSLLFDEARASMGDVTIRTAGGLTAETLFANSAIDLEVGGTFTLLGEARAFTIDVVSSDIEIDDEVGQLGVRDVTSAITLINGNPANETYIGDGEVEGEAYVLDGDEARRLFADSSIFIGVDLDFEGPVANVEIGNLAMSFGTGGNNIGTGGRLEISSPGEIHITGEVALRTSSADDTFRIDPSLIALDTDTGSISMFTGEGGGGTPLGSLELVGDRIVAATGNVIDQLEGMTDLDAITELLSEPGGTGDPLSAGSIDVVVTEGFYIQNSGASDEFADRRGFTAGALTITTESADTQIAINGQILTAAGPVTGLDTAALVTVNDEPATAGGQFDPRSSINGCAIGINCAFERPGDPPTSDDLDPVNPGEPDSSFFIAQLIELAGTEPLITPPLVDEPITGVGNDDLWQAPPCDDEDGDGICPEAEEQP